MSEELTEARRRALAELRAAADAPRGDPQTDTSYTGQIATLKIKLAEAEAKVAQLQAVMRAATQMRAYYTRRGQEDDATEREVLAYFDEAIAHLDAARNKKS